MSRRPELRQRIGALTALLQAEETLGPLNADQLSFAGKFLSLSLSTGRPTSKGASGMLASAIPADLPPSSTTKLTHEQSSESEAAHALWVDHISEVPAASVSWHADARELPSIEDGDETWVDPEPLFSKARVRTLLLDRATTREPSNKVDVYSVVDWIGQGAALRILPYLYVPTIRRGMQLILDVSRHMEPFSHDQRLLARDIEQQLGSAWYQVVASEGAPSDGGRVWSMGEALPYSPPPPGVPVLAVTGFSPGRSTITELQCRGWLELNDALRSRGSWLVTITPTRLERLPIKLWDAFTIVAWDSPSDPRRRNR